MSLYRDRGIVLRTWKLGETDRIIVFLTQENGKIRAVAKGVRKTKSKFGARLEPTSHVELQLFRGRGELDIVTQAETLDRFENLRLDLERFSEASSMLEIIDAFAPDGDSDSLRYRMLFRALRELNNNPAPLLVPAFFLKTLNHEGLAPTLSACVNCDAEVALVAFDVNTGGVLCKKCRFGKSVSESALAVMRAILEGELSKALLISDPKICQEIDEIATMAVEYHLDRRIRSRLVV